MAKLGLLPDLNLMSNTPKDVQTCHLTLAGHGITDTRTLRLNFLQVMGKNKVLVKVHPEGKYVVDLDKNINMADVSAGSPTPVHFIMQEAQPIQQNACTGFR